MHLFLNTHRFAVRKLREDVDELRACGAQLVNIFSLCLPPQVAKKLAV